MKKLLQCLIIVLVFIGCGTANYATQEYIPIKKTPVKYKKSNKIEKSPSTNLIEKMNDNKIAIIFPSYTIGKYALEATNSVNTYLIHKNTNFTLKVYDLRVQNRQNIFKVIAQIQKDNISKVIAMITKEDLVYLNEIPNIDKIQFYFPLINKYDVKNIAKLNKLNALFGAINYKEQFKKLINYYRGRSFVEFYDNSGIGRTLHSHLKNERIKFTKKIDDNNGKYKSFLVNNPKLNNSVLLLNTPIVKSSILLSAINAQRSTIFSIVSTQLNYTPLLFSLTQKNDRKKLIVANSIGKIPSELEEYNNLIGNNLSYSWVNYSITVGVEYLINGNITIFDDLSLKNNQVVYPIKLYRVKNNSFQLIK
ncbi:MAG: hypothetical protein CSA86_04995 [Arcobacter sp.]|nr:MAG: hypothetical protein CSA86_04995 [Arcobacter sp.]